MTAPHFDTEHVTVWHGDCIDVMRTFPDASVDAVVTDPPYGLEFMGKDWDSFGAGANYAGITPTGYTDGGNRLNRPSFNPSPNPTCRKCGGLKFLASEGSGGRKKCHCETGDFPNYLLPKMRAFQAWCEEWATEALRVLKPGGHLLAFGGTRTFHRLTAGIEDAGFEIRDSIAWLYGSGFPKSLDVSKAIDKLDANDERAIRARTFQAWLREHLTPQEVNALTNTDMGHHLTTHPTQPAVATADIFDRLRPHLPEVPAHIEQLVADRTVESQNFAARKVTGFREMVDTSQSRLGFAGSTYGGTGATRTVAETKAHTEDAARWQGWGTALKPAFEPIVVARKPLAGTVAANVLAYGTGALNIDASRIPGEVPQVTQGVSRNPSSYSIHEVPRQSQPHDAGRWPANVILDASQAAALDQMVPNAGSNSTTPGSTTVGMFGTRTPGGTYDTRETGGGASRFFKTVDDLAPRFMYTAKAGSDERPNVDGIAHPTVKSLDLMRWLVKLVTPKGGVVLEPFAGSGTTVEAAVLEGFRCIAIEREADYLPLIMQRVSKPHAVGLDFGDWEDVS